MVALDWAGTRPALTVPISPRNPQVPEKLLEAGGQGETHLLKPHVPQMAGPGRQYFDFDTGENLRWFRGFAGDLGINQRQVQIRHQPVEVVNKLAGVLTTAGIGFIPEVRVNSYVHNYSNRNASIGFSAAARLAG